MRRREREMGVDFALGIVDTCEYAVLSVADGDQPYGIPLSVVRSEKSVYFHTALSGRKLDCLRSNPKASMVCVGGVSRLEHEFSVEYESAVLFGEVREVAEEGEKIAALRLLCEKYTPAHMDFFDEEIARSLRRTGVWKLEISEITGKRKKYGKDGKELKFGRTE